MRLLLGMILGAVLTVAAAYSYDTMHTSSVASGPAAAANRPMVNWDVVEQKWNSVKAQARAGWNQLAARIERG
jgi:hypothetical protein